jgi:hypothetical protein
VRVSEGKRSAERVRTSRGYQFLKTVYLWFEAVSKMIRSFHHSIRFAKMLIFYSIATRILRFLLSYFLDSLARLTTRLAAAGQLRGQGLRRAQFFRGLVAFLDT